MVIWPVHLVVDFLIHSYDHILLSSPAPFVIMSSPDAFDPLACASLHNRIIEIIATAARDQYHNDIIRNFFAAYGEQAEAIRERLPAPVIAFLENIDVPVVPEGGIQINFTPHLSLPTPWMFEQLNPGFPNGLEEDEHENFIVLYGGE
jgi:hypothetical protein